MTNEAVVQIGVAYAASLVMQWLKGQKWFPFLNYDTGRLNAIVAAIIAAASGAGIFFTFDRGAGILTVTGLTTSNLIALAGRAAAQYLLQHFAYRAVIAPPLPGPLQSAERQIEKADEKPEPAAHD
jgi:hypothetical protein